MQGSRRSRGRVFKAGAPSPKLSHNLSFPFLHSKLLCSVSHSLLLQLRATLLPSIGIYREATLCYSHSRCSVIIHLLSYQVRTKFTAVTKTGKVPVMEFLIVNNS